MAKKAQKKVVKKAKKVTKSKAKAPAPQKAVSQVGIEPLGDRIVVRPLTDEEAGTKSAFGIIIPDTASKEKPEQGYVVATGPGRYDEDGERRIPIGVSVGDRVMFSKYGFDEVKVGGKEYFIVPESSVLAIIND